MRKLTFLLTLLIILSSFSISQVRKSGINSLAFLKVGVGAKQVAIGSAATTLKGDPNMMFWNPAGIILEENRTAFAFTYNRWIADITHIAGAVTYNFNNIGTIGLGIISFGLSDISADRDLLPPDLAYLQIDQQTSSTYDFRNIAVVISYARKLTDVLSLGANFKYLHERIDDLSANAFAIDLGANYKVADFWDLGARLSNLGSDIKYYDISSPIPLSFSIGTSFHYTYQGTFTGKLLIDFVQPQDLPQLFFTGLEFDAWKIFFIRAGYKFNYSGTKDKGTSWRSPIETTIEGFSAGVGARLEIGNYGVTFDYAFTQMKLLDNVHRITVGFSLK
ncbi:MAG: PorV/PorQ family protein [Candidatus Kryptonium sp.]|nr:PorV/PorQ family protein [Candidatus Kryptonium sp.]